MRSVAILVHPGVQALDVAGPLDVFGEASGFLPDGAGYGITIVAGEKHAMRSSNGMSITPDLDYAEASSVFDTVLVAGGPAMPDLPRDDAMSRWLGDWGTKARRYGSVCTGAFALGRADLLDDRNVTTHWQNADKLARMFPKTRVEPDRIHLRDGRLMTSAGVTAGIDLALALVAEDHGAGVALSCAKRLVVVAQRQGGQSQFSPYLLSQSTSKSPLGRVRVCVHEHIQAALPMEKLAEIAGTSPRNLARLFTSELGVTPHEFVESVRIDLARNLLEGTDRQLKVVAFDCGFGSAEQMRVIFHKRLGISPNAYRGSFRVVAG